MLLLAVLGKKTDTEK